MIVYVVVDRDTANVLGTYSSSELADQAAKYFEEEGCDCITYTQEVHDRLPDGRLPMREYICGYIDYVKEGKPTPVIYDWTSQQRNVHDTLVDYSRDYSRVFIMTVKDEEYLKEMLLEKYKNLEFKNMEPVEYPISEEEDDLEYINSGQAYVDGVPVWLYW